MPAFCELIKAFGDLPFKVRQTTSGCGEALITGTIATAHTPIEYEKKMMRRCDEWTRDGSAVEFPRLLLLLSLIEFEFD